MTRPDVPESQAREMQALYREAAGAEPSPALDRRILDAARAELESATTAKARPVPWWKGWLPAATALAAVVVGVSLTWRVMDEQERKLREEMSAARIEGENADKAAAARRSAATGAASSAPVSSPQAPERVPLAEAQAIPVAPAAAPVTSAESAKKGKRAEPDAVSKTRDASLAEEAASGLGGAAGKIEARSFGAAADTALGANAAPALAQTGDLAAIEAWLKEIRQLRAAGRNAEAARSLARLRERYPDLVLPDDLLKMK